MTASITCSCKSTVVSYKEIPGKGIRFPDWYDIFCFGFLVFFSHEWLKFHSE